MSNDECLKKREELVQLYHKYIDEIAKEFIYKKPINQNYVDMTNTLMAKIRDCDIEIAMSKQKEISSDIRKKCKM